LGEGFWGIFVGVPLSVCQRIRVLVWVRPSCFRVPPVLGVLVRFFLGGSMLFVAYLFGSLGLLACGLAFLGALFMFPPVECLVLLVCGFCLALASSSILNALEV